MTSDGIRICSDCGTDKHVWRVTVEGKGRCFNCSEERRRAYEESTSEHFLRSVGYWRPDRCEHSPWIRPQSLVQIGWEQTDRDKIIQYLEDGVDIRYWDGHHGCLFGCGGCGSTDVSDGIWLWPAGLWHYVEDHHVMLPNEFVSHMRNCDFEVPDISKKEAQRLDELYRSNTYWNDWCRWFTAQSKAASEEPTLAKSG